MEEAKDLMVARRFATISILKSIAATVSSLAKVKGEIILPGRLNLVTAIARTRLLTFTTFDF